MWLSNCYNSTIVFAIWLAVGYLLNRWAGILWNSSVISPPSHQSVDDHRCHIIIIGLHFEAHTTINYWKLFFLVTFSFCSIFFSALKHHSLWPVNMQFISKIHDSPSSQLYCLPNVISRESLWIPVQLSPPTSTHCGMQTFFRTNSLSAPSIQDGLMTT